MFREQHHQKHLLLQRKFVETGYLVVNVASMPAEQGMANMLKSGPT